MSPIVEFRMRCPEFALAPTLSAIPDARLEVFREGATDPEQPDVLFWAECNDRETFHAALSEDPTVAHVEYYDEVDGRHLYRVRVSTDTGVVTYPGGVELGMAPLETVWQDGWWHLKVRVPRREVVTRAEEWCVANGVEFELDSVNSHAEASTATGLTTEQREVLEAALELGYFEIPREASMADVAEALDLSSQAVSERLRRGYRRLVTETLAD